MSVSVPQAPYLSGVPPIAEDDRECLREIQEVLNRRGKQCRFGVNLIHQHFDLEPDEIMVEDNDPVTRILTVRPQRASDLEQVEYRETSWRLDTLEPTMNCICRTVNNVHNGDHIRTQNVPIPTTCNQ